MAALIMPEARPLSEPAQRHDADEQGGRIGNRHDKTIEQERRSAPSLAVKAGPESRTPVEPHAVLVLVD